MTDQSDLADKRSPSGAFQQALTARSLALSRRLLPAEPLQRMRWLCLVLALAILLPLLIDTAFDFTGGPNLRIAALASQTVLAGCWIITYLARRVPLAVILVEGLALVGATLGTPDATDLIAIFYSGLMFQSLHVRGLPRIWLVSGYTLMFLTADLLDANGIGIPGLVLIPALIGCGFVMEVFASDALREQRIEAEMKELHEKLAHQALHDALTGLPNRNLFEDRLERACVEADRARTTVAFGMMDMNRFKQVNDTLGHAAGDELLKAVADRLSLTVRKSDTVARLGGDEFAFIFAGIHDPAEVVKVASRTLTIFDEPFVIQEQPLQAIGSLGIALYPHHGADAANVLRQADSAMYLAKRDSLSFLIWDESMSETAILASHGRRSMTELDSELKRHVVDVLVVDDNDDNRLLVRTYLANEGYAIREAANGERALDLVRESMPDVVLLDVQMPGLSGYEVCGRLRSMPHGSLVPIIMVTAMHEPMDKVAAADVGADDFISKPFSKLELITRVRSLLRIKALTDALDGAENTIVTLARALEARDPYTRGHSQRVGLYGARLAAKAGLSIADQQAMHLAGILHDVGKIGVCEDILQKPGKLDDGEWETIKRHPIIGAEICAPLRSVKLQLPAIRHHHERWDACGYPDGLGQHNIPLGARITAVCDAWDAMTSTRVYRAGMPVDRAVSILEAGKGTQWDAQLVGLFLANYREISLPASASTTRDPWELALNEMTEAHA